MIESLAKINGEALEQLRTLIDCGIHDFNDRMTCGAETGWNLPPHLPRQQSIHDTIRAITAAAPEVTATTLSHDYVGHLVSLVEHGIDTFDYTLDYSPAEIADLDPPLKARTVLHESILATVRTFQ